MKRNTWLTISGAVKQGGQWMHPLASVYLLSGALAEIGRLGQNDAVRRRRICDMLEVPAIVSGLAANTGVEEGGDAGTQGVVVALAEPPYLPVRRGIPPTQGGRAR